MRITREQMWMEMAVVAAKRSTCLRGSVGAVIVSENRNVKSVGYNGPPSGFKHCREGDCDLSKPCDAATHAEINAMNHCDWRGPHDHYAMYVTVAPCFDCAVEIAKAGIDTVYYSGIYSNRIGLEYLLRKCVTVARICADGIILHREDDDDLIL